MLRGRSAGSPRGKARAGRVPRDPKASITLLRSRRRRHGAESVRKNLGPRRGVEGSLEPVLQCSLVRFVFFFLRLLWSFGVLFCCALGAPKVFCGLRVLWALFCVSDRPQYPGLHVISMKFLFDWNFIEISSAVFFVLMKLLLYSHPPAANSEPPCRCSAPLLRFCFPPTTSLLGFLSHGVAMTSQA